MPARAEDGTAHSARLTVPVPFSNLRVPFSAFASTSYFAFDQDAPDLPAPLEPQNIRAISVRYEPARRAPPAVLMPGDRGAGDGDSGSARRFRLEIDRIKARGPGAPPSPHAAERTTDMQYSNSIAA